MTSLMSGITTGGPAAGSVTTTEPTTWGRASASSPGGGVDFERQIEQALHPGQDEGALATERWEAARLAREQSGAASIAPAADAHPSADRSEPPRGPSAEPGSDRAIEVRQRDVGRAHRSMRPGRVKRDPSGPNLDDHPIDRSVHAVQHDSAGASEAAAGAARAAAARAHAADHAVDDADGADDGTDADADSTVAATATATTTSAASPGVATGTGAAADDAATDGAANDAPAAGTPVITGAVASASLTDVHGDTPTVGSTTPGATTVAGATPAAPPAATAPSDGAGLPGLPGLVPPTNVPTGPTAPATAPGVPSTATADAAVLAAQSGALRSTGRATRAGGRADDAAPTSATGEQPAASPSSSAATSTPSPSPATTDAAATGAAAAVAAHQGSTSGGDAAGGDGGAAGAGSGRAGAAAAGTPTTAPSPTTSSGGATSAGGTAHAATAPATGGPTAPTGAQAGTGTGSGTGSATGSATSGPGTSPAGAEAPLPGGARFAAPAGHKPLLGHVDTRRLEMDLGDEGLGPLRLSALTQAGTVHLTLSAADPQVRDALARQSYELRRDLEGAGIQLGTFDVGADSQRRGDRTPDDADRADRSTAPVGTATSAATTARTGSAPRRPGARIAADAGLDLMI
jgi:flagellar hook-length control protein FliK